MADAAGPAGKEPAKPQALAKARQKAERKVREMQEELAAVESQVVDVESDPSAMHYLAHHAGIGQAVLEETAKLHSGDPVNLELWQKFMPSCYAEIARIYGRLAVKFDHVLGESFYHDRLAAVVDDLIAAASPARAKGRFAFFCPAAKPR